MKGDTFRRHVRDEGDRTRKEGSERGKGGRAHTRASRTHLGLFPRFSLLYRKGPHCKREEGERGEVDEVHPSPRTLRARARVLTCPFQHPSLSYRV